MHDFAERLNGLATRRVAIIEDVKRALLLLGFVGCMERGGSGSYNPGPQPIDTSNVCMFDTDCGAGNVCARDGGCYAASQVKSASVSWTLQGQPASQTTCASSTDLQLDFIDGAGRPGFGFAPVPCMEGRFSIDKLPSFYVGAQIGTTAAPGAVAGTFDSKTSQLTLDLPY
jgi:hypothetical protein